MEFQRACGRQQFTNRLRVIKKNVACHSKLKSPFQTQISYQKYILIMHLNGALNTWNDRQILYRAPKILQFVNLFSAAELNIYLRSLAARV